MDIVRLLSEKVFPTLFARHRFVKISLMPIKFGWVAANYIALVTLHQRDLVDLFNVNVQTMLILKRIAAMRTHHAAHHLATILALYLDSLRTSRMEFSFVPIKVRLVHGLAAKTAPKHNISFVFQLRVGSVMGPLIELLLTAFVIATTVVQGSVRFQMISHTSGRVGPGSARGADHADIPLGLVPLLLIPLRPESVDVSYVIDKLWNFFKLGRTRFAKVAETEGYPIHVLMTRFV